MLFEAELTEIRKATAHIQRALEELEQSNESLDFRAEGLLGNGRDPSPDDARRMKVLLQSVALRHYDIGNAIDELQRQVSSIT
jgi:hypothetical protein